MKVSSLFVPGLVVHCSTVAVSAWVPTARPTTSRRTAAVAPLGHRFRTQQFSTLATQPEEDTLAAEAAAETLLSSSSFRVVIGEGPIVAQFPGGLKAIRIQDDIQNTAAAADATATYAPSLGGLTAPITTATSSNNANGELQGKQVEFADGSLGVVVAHRPPIIFVIPIDQQEKEDGNYQDGSVVKILRSPVCLSLGDGDQALDNALTKGDIISFTGQSLSSTTNNNQQKQQQHGGEYSRPIFAPIPQVKDIALINTPVLSGITMFDALSPIGRGQNMLMIGSSTDLSTIMRPYAMDMMETQINSNNSNTKCIYAVSDASQQDSILQLLKDRGLEKQVHVIVPRINDKKDSTDGNDDDDDVSSKAARTVAVTSSACALAELFALKKGAHTLVIVDTIDEYKTLWDTTTRVLVDVFGADAVVRGDREGGASSEMRAFYSSLIQRSAQYKVSRGGGGSVTLLLLTTLPPLQESSTTDNSSNSNSNSEESTEEVFLESDFEHCSDKIKARLRVLLQRNIPLTAATLRKIDIPIPSSTEAIRRYALQHVDDLISMSDGQIWLSDQNDPQQQTIQHFPPLDPQRSLARIGIGADTESRADAPAIRRIVERSLRLDWSQASDLLSSSSSGATATAFDSNTQRQLTRQAAWRMALWQLPGTGGRRLSESCVALLAASQGHLDDFVASDSVVQTHHHEESETLMKNLFEYVAQVAAPVMASIDETLDVADDQKKQLSDAILAFFETTTTNKQQ